MKVSSMYKILGLLLLILIVVTSVSGCKKKGKCGESNISQSGSDESHNFGQNCMQCHTSGGKGEGCFKVAGSVSNSALTSPLSSGTVKFYTQIDGGGILKYTIDIDAKGNFHTTESIDVTGLFPTIVGSDGVPHHMGASLTSGSCNTCHGVSTDKLWAN